LGKYLGMQFGNPRNKIWKKLFKKWDIKLL
jgi:hypothetical protein